MAEIIIAGWTCSDEKGRQAHIPGINVSVAPVSGDLMLLTSGDCAAVTLFSGTRSELQRTLVPRDVLAWLLAPSGED